MTRSSEQMRTTVAEAASAVSYLDLSRIEAGEQLVSAHGVEIRTNDAESSRVWLRSQPLDCVRYNSELHEAIWLGNIGYVADNCQRPDCKRNNVGSFGDNHTVGTPYGSTMGRSPQPKLSETSPIAQSPADCFDFGESLAA